MRGLLSGSWATRLAGRPDLKTLSVRVRGKALARPRRGRDRACLAFSVKSTAFEAPRGTLRLLGGTGRYARLRVSAGFAVTFKAGKAKLSGIAAVRRGPARALPRGCRGLRR